MRIIPRSVELLLGTPSRNPRQRGLHNSVYRTHPFHAASTTIHEHRRPHSQSRLSASSRRQAQPLPVYAFGEKTFKRHVHGQQAQDEPHPDPRDQHYATNVDALLAALRQNDTVKLYFCLLDLTRGAQPHDIHFCRAVRSIPPTTFSELLRSFDPFHISRHVDSAPNIPISWGAAIYTPLGELVNKWGVKLLYVRILNRLRLLQDTRRRVLPSSHGDSIRPLLHDYVILLRCAGATSSIHAAKKVWHELFTDGYALWKHPQLFAEFIKARYLTESLYANSDLARFRLRPLDMHRNRATYLDRKQIFGLKKLRAAMLNKHAHRFGQNTQEIFFAEPLTRLLRKRMPLRRLQRRAVIRHMLPGDELLLCAILKANGRQGQLYASTLLMRFWGIEISPFIEELGRRKISGGHDFAAGAAQAPTEALLDAVVHCYGNQGEVPLATALVDFISRRWNIAVPDRVWSDLLSLARIHATAPAAMEWRIAEMHTKVSSPRSVVGIWQLCTQAPYNFQPSMKDYDCLIKSLLQPMQSLHRPLEAIRQVKPLYFQTVQRVQDAWAELIWTTQQGVPNHRAYRRYRMLLATKHYLWYCFHYMSTQALKTVKPIKVDDHTTIRLVPQIVAELGSFMPACIQYRIATGIVYLRLDNNPLKLVARTQGLQLPEQMSDRPSFFTNTAKGSHSSGPGSGASNKVDSLLNINLPFSSGPLDKNVQKAAMRDYMLASGLGDPWRDGQLDTDDQVEEENEDANELKGMDHDDEAGSKTDKQHVEQGAAHANGLDQVGEHGGVRPVPTRPTPYFQDAFEESRNPDDTFPLDKDLDEYAERERPSARDVYEDAFASIHQTHTDLSDTQHIDDRDAGDTTGDVQTTWRRGKAWQYLNRPAYMKRPRYSGPSGEPSISSMRQEGGDFTGYHQNPVNAHFAAHRIVRTMKHAPGIPVDLSGAAVSESQWMTHLLWPNV